MYYSLFFKYATDGTLSEKILKDFDSLDEALIYFHSQLSKTISTDGIGKCVAEVLDADGNVMKYELWQADTDDDETEDTTEES